MLRDLYKMVVLINCWQNALVGLVVFPDLVRTISFDEVNCRLGAVEGSNVC